MTNFDLLKENLTPQELAEYICEDAMMNTCNKCIYQCKECGFNCLSGVIKWLESERVS